MKPSHYVANFDSSTGCLRALSRFLHGRDYPALGSPGGNALLPAVRLVSALPRQVRERIYSWSGWGEAIQQHRLARVDAEAMARWVVGHYPRGRRYPALALGSSSGAMVHLCAALGIPWIPQTFLIPVRGHFSPDEPHEALRRGQRLGPRLLEHNPELVLHQMHDVAQDRLMLRHMMYFRVKRRRLGRALCDYLTESLEPGGTLFLVECGLRWPTRTVGPRHVFQFGAQGGITPQEHHEGSPRVEQYLRDYDVPLRHWDVPEPDGESPEAEWGFEPGLREDVEALARQKGYRVRCILFPEPNDLSPLVADLYQWWYRQRRMEARRLVVESFVEMEPWWVLRTGSVPFWMQFNTEVSCQALGRFLDGHEPFEEILLMLMQHGTRGPGLAPIDAWKELLARASRRGEFLGVDPRKHPEDYASFVRYHTELRKKVSARYPMPPPLGLGQLERFLEEAGERYPVRWEDSVTPRRAPSAPPESPEAAPEAAPEASWVH